jgi:hypothetical protein
MGIWGRSSNPYKEDSKGFKTAMEEEARNLSKSINAYCDEHK